MAKLPNSATKPNRAALFMIQLAIACGLFAADIFLGPGIADGIGYSIVLVLCLWSSRPFYSLGWAGFTTLLAVAGGVISPDGGAEYTTWINRGMEICTIWVVWFLVQTIAPTSGKEPGPQ